MKRRNKIILRWVEELEESTKTGLVYGKANTYKILEMGSELDLDESNCATYRVSRYSTAKTSAGDWWLPSKDELDLMYKSQKDRVLATLLGETTYYWSSSMSDDRYAWGQDFDDGDQYNDYDGYYYSVRGVRSF